MPVLAPHRTGPEGISWAVVSGSENPLNAPIDSNGNLCSEGGTTCTNGTQTYTWDAENRLVSVSQGGITLASFTYNKEGMRTSKTAGGVTTSYVLDGTSVVEERVTGGGTVKHFQGQGVDRGLASQDGGGAVTYYVRDHLGSTRQSTNASGEATLTRDYDPWGNGEPAARGSFTGREWDSEAGLYYYRARYYDPSQGRFVSNDPIGLGGGSNFYVYVLNAPVAVTDPFGLHPRSGPCDRVCEIAAALDPSAIGKAVCCQGTLYACYWKSRDSLAGRDPKADQILEDCTLLHERIHFYTVEPCPCNGISVPKPTIDVKIGECHAFIASALCLQRRRKECNNVACTGAIDAAMQSDWRYAVRNCPTR